jgi:hypothetical protein
VSDAVELRAADADRERTVVALREHMAEGRLTLEEFAERMERAWTSKTDAELDVLVRDLPSIAPPRRRTALLLSVFSSTVRAGRLRLGRRTFCISVFGNVDLDLREATLERGRLTVFLFALFGTGDIYVPEGVDADITGAVVFGHARANGHDAPRPDAPAVRVVAIGLFGGLDLWRVPTAWRDRGFRDVIKGIRRGQNLELGA